LCIDMSKAQPCDVEATPDSKQAYDYLPTASCLNTFAHYFPSSFVFHRHRQRKGNPGKQNTHPTSQCQLSISAITYSFIHHTGQSGLPERAVRGVYLRVGEREVRDQPEDPDRLLADIRLFVGDHHRHHVLLGTSDVCTVCSLSCVGWLLTATSECVNPIYGA